MLEAQQSRDVADAKERRCRRTIVEENTPSPMGRGSSIGNAFVQWWKARGPVHKEWELTDPHPAHNTGPKGLLCGNPWGLLSVHTGDKLWTQ
jgi:hypothetical protein